MQEVAPRQRRKVMNICGKEAACLWAKWDKIEMPEGVECWGGWRTKVEEKEERKNVAMGVGTAEFSFMEALERKCNETFFFFFF